LKQEIANEKDLLQQVQNIINGYKKSINEVRREKERLLIGLKGTFKILDNLEKRRETLDGDSTKLYQDFKGTLDKSFL